MSKILKVSASDQEKIEKVICALKEGKIVVLPTETVYGFGCDFYNESGKKKLTEIKKRPENKPFPIAVFDKSQIERFLFPLPTLGYKLIREFLPGPLTLVFKIDDKKNLAFRIPKDRVTLKILERFSKPVAFTSVNISGQKPLIDIIKIEEVFGKDIEIIVDSGVPQIGIASTVCFVKDGDFEILREGPIKKEDIQKIKDTKNVLFVCTGNSCRSVMCEHLLKKYGKSNMKVDSCGLYAFEGAPASSLTIELLKKEGIQISHRAKKCDVELFKYQDYIFVMENMHKESIIKNFPYLKDRVFLLTEFVKGEAKNIVDPIAKPAEVYEEIFREIKNIIIKLSEVL